MSGARLVGPWAIALAVVLAIGAPARAQGTATAGASGPVLVFETEKGTIEIETFQAQAPRTVAHVAKLVAASFYDGLRIHRVVPDFVVQLGDPQSRDLGKRDLWGTGGSGTPIGIAEFSKVLRHVVGMVSMSHAGDATRADSQFFIVLGPASQLDGKHQVFGRVTSGMAVVRALAVDDRIVRATVKAAR
jgi:peptidyl-prolyl cis-trans isomerase B (cyclophilin B)